MSSQLTLPGMSSATSSEAFPGGPLPSNSPAGPTTSPAGPARALVKASRRRASAAAATIPGICGPSGADSLQSANLLWSSASKSLPQTPSGRLQARLGAAIIRNLQPYGSMVYKQAWKARATPSGFMFLAHTASARTTSGSGCTGWPTATVNDATGSEYAYSGGNHDKPMLKLPGAAKLAGWATPAARDEKGIDQNYHDGAVNNSLPYQVANLAGWSTPTKEDGHAVSDLEAEIMGDTKRRKKATCVQRLRTQALGPTSSSSPAGTTKCGVLAPGFPLWLQGFPEIWRTCCPGWQSWDTMQKLLAELCERPDGIE